MSSADLEDYDEFGFLEDTSTEWGLPWPGAPQIARGEIEVEAGRKLSYLKWGADSPELVFLHGGGQNAHTWDTVLLALGRPAIAFDLPGHGHSYWREDRDYSPVPNAEALSQVIPKLAPDAAAIVGMSLGGATTIRLAGTYPQLVRKAVIVDVTPQVNDPSRTWTREQRGTVALVGEGTIYDSFEAMADEAVSLSPYRSPESVRRGVRHNAKRLPDGRWAWRYDLAHGGGRAPRPSSDFTKLWDDVDRIRAPAMLVLGGESVFVRPQDAEEMKRRLPTLRTEIVPGAGHAVQSDRPLDLVRLIEDFVFGK